MSPVMGTERTKRGALSGGVYGGGGEGIDAVARLLNMHTATHASQDCDCICAPIVGLLTFHTCCVSSEPLSRREC